ncbi:RraA family protein [Croceicoccus naphthovorans]|uniref:Putative 4-hydroxy-4-methyl-2-oxoglutarate aldolase n=1 Tax=Croceicoccus naphthovorans TaxID=1348774 RepID=A0A0G3XLH5_9SPHN|nr:diguanylate cyclase [Croceicoccus naphthovorans]AKM12042.1 diguanylate cyclase [Croceicoccus naphthovorans]ART40739.1 L345 [uncultured bacterium]EZP70087.1 Dimethylmenaquinone methyltransferase [Sphingomonas paucimobilis]MBB3992030.1 regulator of RNase E activity RraA [Croceicoccus naphthovorans]
MSEETLVRRLNAVGVTALSDALDRLAISGQAIGILPVARGMKFAGPAFTVQMLPVGLTQGIVGDYIDDVPEGAVVAIDNGGKLDQTVWGDILTRVAHKKGVAGTVIDGVCRDSDCCVLLKYPVFSRSVTMRTAKDRSTAHAYGVPIQLVEVRIEPGDWLVGDSDGVVAIPAGRVEEVVAIAEEVEIAEKAILAAVDAGMRLDEARRAGGYHSLQSRAV